MGPLPPPAVLAAMLPPQPSLVFFDTGGTVKLGGFSVIRRFVCPQFLPLSLSTLPPSLPPSLHPPTRLSDLHRAMSTKPSLSTPISEVEPSPWLQGTLEKRGGKKGDILKLVSCASTDLNHLVSRLFSCLRACCCCVLLRARWTSATLLPSPRTFPIPSGTSLPSEGEGIGVMS